MSKLVNQLDAIEIKFTVQPEQVKLAKDLLQLETDDAEKRKIYFCEDTQAFFSNGKFRLLDNGIILRLRKNDNSPDDSTVKIRPAPLQISSEWRTMEGFKLEGDWVGDRKVDSASFTVEQQDGEIEAVVMGKRSLNKLFSKKQEQFLKLSTTIEINLEELQILGPIEAFRWKLKTYSSLIYPICSECWNISDGQQLLELSIRVPLKQAWDAQQAFIQYLANNHLNPNGVQETKTRTALEYLAKITGLTH